MPLFNAVVIAFRKFYDSVVDLLVNFGNFGSLDMS